MIFARIPQFREASQYVNEINISPAITIHHYERHFQVHHSQHEKQKYQKSSKKSQFVLVVSNILYFSKRYKIMMINISY